MIPGVVLGDVGAGGALANASLLISYQPGHELIEKRAMNILAIMH